MLEAAAVEGREFRRSSVEALVGLAAPVVDDALASLVRRDLIRPADAAEREFGFRHILVRDAAYAALPKETRADLHERFAGHLERDPATRTGELDEIVAYHLAQAYELREEVAALTPADDELGLRAGLLFDRAGRRVYARGDMHAAARLLGRAARFLPTGDPERVTGLILLGIARRDVGEFTGAEEALLEAIEVGDEVVAADARIRLEQLRTYTHAGRGAGPLLAAAEDALPVFEAAGDDARCATALRFIGFALWNRCRAREAEECWLRALTHLTRPEHEGARASILWNLATSALTGPTPVAAAIDRCLTLRVEADRSPNAGATFDLMLGSLEAIRERFDEARAHFAAARRTAAELENPLLELVMAPWEGAALLLAGAPAEAESVARTGLELAAELGDAASVPQLAAVLAEALNSLGRHGEALAAAELGAGTVWPDDLISRVPLQAAHARARAATGARAEAAELARATAALVAESDCPSLRGDAAAALADVLPEPAEADAAFADALRLYAEKGNRAAAARAAERRALRAAATP